ncbi:hypothetical protein CcaCcLH18_13480 [Colletotrichum camelliae]|nr:hypothetical protein CcaCcLH18_13480 [Colletotrichum camelliae]
MLASPSDLALQHDGNRGADFRPVHRHQFAVLQDDSVYGTIDMILTITYRLWQVLWSLLPTSPTPAQMRETLHPDILFLTLFTEQAFLTPSGLIIVLEDSFRFADEPLIPRRLRRIRGLRPMTHHAVTQLPW